MDRNTDRDWEEFGRTEPYWAVLTDEKYKLDKLTSQSLEDFFHSGDSQVSWTFDQIRNHVDPEFDPASGARLRLRGGTIDIPPWKRCRSVTGVDVSPVMLEKAREHAADLGLSNVTFVRGDDELSTVEGPFDFINTYIVLQHIPPDRGERLICRLLELLRDRGVGALHLTYSKSFYEHDRMHRPPVPVVVRTTLRAFLGKIKRRLLRGRSLFMPTRGAPPQDGPCMQMNDYCMNRVLHFLQEGGVRRMVTHFSDHGGNYGTLLLFRKEPTETYRV